MNENEHRNKTIEAMKKFFAGRPGRAKRPEEKVKQDKLHIQAENNVNNKNR